MPFASAVARLESKTPVASALRTDAWAEISLGLRDRAFFSAGVESLRTVATMQQKIDDALRLTRDDKTASMDKAKFIAEMREALGAAPGDSRKLTDITSTARLGLIYDFQVEDAHEFGRWQAQQDPAILDEFPAQELIRVEAREKTRDWAQRWVDAGGKSYGGRMIARKDDPVWKNISRFGRPWPPFDFGSGMGLDEVDRDEAEALGVIQPGESVAPQEADFNQNLQASVPHASPAVLDGFKEIFGDQVDVSRDGKITWQGQRVKKLYDAALSDPSVKWSLDLGRASFEASQMAKAAGAELPETARLQLTADDVRHIMKEHGAPGVRGPGTGETNPAQRPITRLDLQLIPHVWRAPDAVTAGKFPGTLEMSADIAGRRSLITFDRQANSGAWGVRTLWVKKEGPKS